MKLISFSLSYPHCCLSFALFRFIKSKFPLWWWWLFQTFDDSFSQQSTAEKKSFFKDFNQWVEMEAMKCQSSYTATDTQGQLTLLINKKKVEFLGEAESMSSWRWNDKKLFHLIFQFRFVTSSDLSRRLLNVDKIHSFHLDEKLETSWRSWKHKRNSNSPSPQHPNESKHFLAFWIWKTNKSSFTMNGDGRRERRTISSKKN